ncbi:MAG TPA: LemA family protein [Candidatus Saccharimonadales bacterium]|nr:LemA family protein [Candidatus Saccharimonadales bacterium]
MTILYIVLAIVAVILLFVWVTYNGLVRLNVRVNEAWSDITIQLKRRYDLIPNLVNAVKGYATHEKEVFEKVTEARANALTAQQSGKVKDVAAAENQFEGALKSIFAVAEAYPELRATENFQKLQDELTDTEDKIMASRRFYNGGVRDLNTKIQTFPSNVFAGMLGFKQREFFEVENLQDVEKPVEVTF